MDHLQPFRARRIFALPTANENGWNLKRYAILSDGRKFDDSVADAALSGSLNRLPKAGSLHNETGNHGVGFQIVHFAQVAVVAPTFYWRWGSVISKIGQMRAQWETPTHFEDGVEGVVGCLWEMEIVSFEADAWKRTMLVAKETPASRLQTYLKQHFAVQV